MTTIYLIRHAEAEGNLYRRVHGWYDSLITDNGYRQIAALANRFQNIPIDAVYASDLFRTKTTAGAVCQPKGLPLRTRPDLREIGLGIWEDCTWGELARRDGERLWCEDSTDYRLPVLPGDRLSLVARTSRGCLMKKNGVTGWYSGRLTDTLEKQIKQ